MLKKIKMKLNNKKGSAVIEFVIALLILVTLIAFVVDILIVGNKRFLVAQETTEIARVIGIQGGVSSVVPAGYPGGNKAYLTSIEMYKQIDEKMKGSNIENTEWQANLTEYNKSGQAIRKVILTPQTVFKVDYMNSMDIQIEASYNWTLMSQVTGGLLDVADVGAKRHTVSEFKYNFDKWEGEEY